MARIDPEAIKQVLDSGDKESIAIIQKYLESPYYQFEPREDRPELGDEMTSYVTDKHPGKIVLGGTGSSKTFTTAWLVADTLFSNEPPEPNTPVWILATTLDQVGLLWSQALRKFISKDHIESIRWRKTNLYPEIVQMKPNEKGNSWSIFFYSSEQGREALQAATVWLAWIDEQAPADVIEEVGGRLRRWEHPNKFLLTCTPLKPDPWLEDLWSRRDDPAIANSFKFYRLNSVLNDYLSVEWRRDYLGSLSPDQRLTRQFGDFSNYKGAVFPEFTNELIIDPFNTDGPDFEQYIGVDFGFHHPAISWVAKHRDGTYYVVDENQLSDVTPDIVARTIKRRYDWRHKVYSDYEDIISARILTANGVHNSPCVGKDVLDSINMCKNLFWQKKIKVFKTCLQTIRQLRGYRWKQFKDDREVKDEVVKVDDHIVDCIRYVVYSSAKRSIKPWTQPESTAVKVFSGQAGVPQIMKPNPGFKDLFNRR